MPCQTSMSHELGRHALRSLGIVNVELPEVLQALLRATSFEPDFEINFAEITIPDQPLPLVGDLPTGNFWWTWPQNGQTGYPEWWRNPTSAHVSGL